MVTRVGRALGRYAAALGSQSGTAISDRGHAVVDNAVFATPALPPRSTQGDNKLNNGDDDEPTGGGYGSLSAARAPYEESAAVCGRGGAGTPERGAQESGAGAGGSTRSGQRAGHQPGRSNIQRSNRQGSIVSLRGFDGDAADA